MCCFTLMTRSFFYCILIVWTIFLLEGATAASVNRGEEKTKLVLVSVIFRHGARTTYSFYPTDPNINETFYPIGLGGLTNDGKLGEYKLGRYLRHLYGDFIGEDYTEDKVYVRSTDVTRTKMSAQLVLAGLFPPSKIQLWNEELMWQPIPVSYKVAEEEDLFHPYDTCPYKYNAIQNLPFVQEIQDIYIKPFQSIYSYIQNKSRKPIGHPADMQDFFFILKTENDMDLEIPEWTQTVYPEPTHSIAGTVYRYHNYDRRVRQINSGYMLKKIVEEDFSAKISNALTPSTRKIFLYSGHETTIGYMLDALNVGLEAHVPPYGSAISFELLKGTEKYYIKLRYRNDTDGMDPVDLQIPGCDILCPIEKFLELQRDLIPSVPIEVACNPEKVISEKPVVEQEKENGGNSLLNSFLPS